MDVAVIGAGGDVGRAIVTTLVSEHIMPPTSRLQLVAHKGGPSEPLCLGLAVDVRDADIETAPAIEVIVEPRHVDADVVIFVAGATIGTDPAGSPGNEAPRARLAEQNLPLFNTYADALSRSLRPDSMVVVVSNPVELAVRVLAGRLGAERVLGMGSHLDSLRFRRELAHDLGLRRQQVQGLVLGEHGAAQVPCWSTVRVWGGPGVDAMNDPAQALRDEAAPSLAEAMATMRGLLADGRPKAGFDFVQELPPDRRAAVKPFFAHFTGAKTTVGTARAAADFVDSLFEGHIVVTGGQREVTTTDDTSALGGLTGCTGVPLQVEGGRSIVSPMTLAQDEVRALQDSAARFDEFCVEVGLDP